MVTARSARFARIEGRFGFFLRIAETGGSGLSPDSPHVPALVGEGHELARVLEVERHLENGAL